MKFAIMLLILGIMAIGYSLVLSPYKNEELYQKRYMELTSDQNEEFHKLRDEMLTPKYRLQDYGITFVAMAVAVFAVFRNGKINLKSPKFGFVLALLAVVLPFLTIGGYIFEIFLSYYRGDYPHWADTIMIPLMGSIPSLGILLLWTLIHLFLFLRGDYHPATPLAHAVSFKANWWLLFVSTITAGLVIISTLAGDYWYAIPGMLWLYVYLSLSANRRALKET